MSTLEASVLKTVFTTLQMKIKFKHFLLLLFFFISVSSFSQTKNSVKIHSAGFSFPSIMNEYNKKYSYHSINSIAGISYEREIKNNFAIGGQYALWWGKPLSRGPRVAVATNELIGDSASLDKILSRFNFNTYDVYGIYNIILNKNIKIGLKAGPSITKGENEYLRSFMYYSQEEPVCLTFETETVKETYYGAFTSLSFDYIFWQGRIPVGVDFSGRFYRNFPFQVNYGLHLGYNF